MASFKDDEAARLERIESLRVELMREMSDAREEGRVIAEQMKESSDAAFVRAISAHLRAEAARQRANDISVSSAKRTRRNGPEAR